MIEFLKVEGTRLHVDGPTTQTVTNQGPDKLFIGDANVSVADSDQTVDVDKSVDLDGGHFLVSAGRSRIVVQRPDPDEVRITLLEARVEALENKGSSAKKPAAKAKK